MILTDSLNRNIEMHGDEIVLNIVRKKNMQECWGRKNPNLETRHIAVESKPFFPSFSSTSQGHRKRHVSTLNAMYCYTVSQAVLSVSQPVQQPLYESLATSCTVRRSEASNSGVQHLSQRQRQMTDDRRQNKTSRHHQDDRGNSACHRACSDAHGPADKVPQVYRALRDALARHPAQLDPGARIGGDAHAHVACPSAAVLQGDHLARRLLE